jgi:predicted metal-dependent hydrolase
MTVTEAPPTPRLKVRKPQLDFGRTPKYWVLGDPQSTHALNILNFGIPAGERFFIDSVRLALPYITDNQLAADARAFIGQESVHARMHERAADHLGLFEIPEIRQRIEAADRRRVALYKRIDAMPEPFRRRAVRAWLSTTLLGEHFTALFADLALGDNVDEEAVDPTMAHLIHWHAAEELEHRTLPYDVFKHIGGGYFLRVTPLAATGALMPLGLIALTDAIMRLDPDLERGFSLPDYIRAVRARRTLNLMDVLAKLPMYFLPWYHPSHLGGDARARAWLASNVPSPDRSPRSR